MSHVPQDSVPQPNAAEKADALYHNYLAGGPDAAYASLKRDYDAAAGMCNRDQYFQEVANDLQSAGHMPNIAVGWLKAEKDHLDRGHDGVIDKQDILDAKANGGLDAIFGKVVLTQVPSPGDNKTFFDQVAHTKRAWSDSPDGIEDADLRKYSRQMHRAERRENNHEETAAAAAPLFDNHAELLKALDTGPNGERNNFISRREMKNFLKEYKEHPDQGVYTADNAEYVNELLHGEIGRVSNHPFHGFGVARLERRAGMTDEDQEKQPPGRDLVYPNGAAAAAAKLADAANCDVPTAPPERAPTKPVDHASPCSEIEIRNHLDRVSRVQPGEGYNAVAARLLNIFPGHPRTHEEVQDIQILGRQIQKLNGDQSTLRLRTGVVLPVSANMDLLMDENPRLKATIQNMRNSFVQAPEQAAIE